jgi:hypothetical protein
VNEQPNPGSEEAVRKGCTCAVLDNNHGRFAPRPPNDWWITSGCPLHGAKRRSETMKVPEEFVDAAYRSVYGCKPQRTPESVEDWQTLNEALEAVLPKVRERLETDLELDKLRSELQHIAEKCEIPGGYGEDFAVDVAQWAEGWLLTLHMEASNG